MEGQTAENGGGLNVQRMHATAAEVLFSGRRVLCRIEVEREGQNMEVGGRSFCYMKPKISTAD
jgi:hypothetical protein